MLEMYQRMFRNMCAGNVGLVGEGDLLVEGMWRICGRGVKREGLGSWERADG